MWSVYICLCFCLGEVWVPFWWNKNWGLLSAPASRGGWEWGVWSHQEIVNTQHYIYIIDCFDNILCSEIALPGQFPLYITGSVNNSGFFFIQFKIPQVSSLFLSFKLNFSCRYEFFNELYHRFLLTPKVAMKCLCLQALTIVYGKCYEEIGPFTDTKYIVGMLDKVSSFILR